MAGLRRLIVVGGGAAVLLVLRRRVAERGSMGSSGRSLEVIRAATIARPRAQVYAFWRDFTNLPRFMLHLESVRVSDDGRSHWVAAGPVGRPVEWDAEIVEDQPGELIAWRSIGRATPSNRGTVRFADAPGGRGTEVRVSLDYDPPGGGLGSGLARLTGREPSQQLAEDLRHLKQVLESGEIVTAAGQPVGPGGEGRPVERYARLLTHVFEALDPLRGKRGPTERAVAKQI